MAARRSTILICAIGTLQLGACDRAPTEAPAPTPVAIANTPEEQCDPAALVPMPTQELKPLGEIEVTSIDGTYVLRIRLDPDPPKLNELFGMRVEVRHAAGQTKDFITISADAAMPLHGHGMTVRPGAMALSGQATGNYLVSGMMFHMPGSWKVSIDITEGAFTERANFDIEVY